MRTTSLRTCARTGEVGVNLWARTFPGPRGHDYRYNPKQLGDCWGIAEGEICAERRADVLTRYQRVCLIVHPDKYPEASGNLKRRLAQLEVDAGDAKGALP